MREQLRQYGPSRPPVPVVPLFGSSTSALSAKHAAWSAASVLQHSYHTTTWSAGFSVCDMQGTPLLHVAHLRAHVLSMSTTSF